jgi:GAF domain-containing protein/HAMP domain-containing protein
MATLSQNLQQTIRGAIFTQLAPMVAVMLAGLSLLIWAIAGRLVTPLQKLARAAQRLTSGGQQPSDSPPLTVDEWQTAIQTMRQVDLERGDEIGVLAGALATVADELQDTFSGLETRVAERTAELEQRSLQLQTAAEVAQEIALARRLDTLLERAVNLIRQRFGYYHVAVFLIDDSGEYAQLQAASRPANVAIEVVSDAPVRDGLHNLRLRVGQQGMVGYVTRYGQSRMAADVQAEQTYLSNPLLPETRSEVTLPLRSGPKIVGALDVQSTRLAAFSQDDILVLQTLADQLAVAIENVRLLSQLSQAMQEAQNLYQRQTQEAWRQLTARQGVAAFEYDGLQVAETRGRDTAWLAAIWDQPDNERSGTQVLQHGDRLLVPLSLRGQVIGFIGVESQAPGHRWSEDEIAILQATANQAAISVENARLLAESQRRAARERLAAEVTSQMRASLDIEMVVNTAMREIAHRLGIAQVEVILDEAGFQEGGQDETHD